MSATLNPLFDPEGHRWVAPAVQEQPPCPDCVCCTDRLCREAHRAGLSCGIVAGPVAFELVNGCSCGLAAQEARLQAIGAAAEERRRRQDDEQRKPFVCPRCGAVSWHPQDLEHGYCGACHDFTGGDA